MGSFVINVWISYGRILSFMLYKDTQKLLHVFSCTINISCNVRQCVPVTTKLTSTIYWYVPRIITCSVSKCCFHYDRTTASHTITSFSKMDQHTNLAWTKCENVNQYRQTVAKSIKGLQYWHEKCILMYYFIKLFLSHIYPFVMIITCAIP
jgi:hypothetical protein